MTKTVPKEPRIDIRQRDDGTLLVGRPLSRFRYLFDDGSTVDVIDDRDDSEVREAVRLYAGKERIVGVARLPEQGAML